MEGWIKIHRKILENPVVCKDSETFSIWLFLLLSATHQEIPAVFKGEKITLKKGQLITGILSISKKLKINKDKVQRTLKCFETDKQIVQETSNKNRLITILNWEQYQSNDNQDDKQMINKCETTDKQLITNKNVKNNYIYINLLNKYRERIEEEPKRTIQIISELKRCADYEKLTVEEQDNLFYELMCANRRIRNEF